MILYGVLGSPGVNFVIYNHVTPPALGGWCFEYSNYFWRLRRD